jgi:hypothetical protein
MNPYGARGWGSKRKGKKRPPLSGYVTRRRSEEGVGRKAKRPAAVSVCPVVATDRLHARGDAYTSGALDGVHLTVRLLSLHQHKQARESEAEGDRRRVGISHHTQYQAGNAMRTLASLAAVAASSGRALSPSSTNFPSASFFSNPTACNAQRCTEKKSVMSTQKGQETAQRRDLRRSAQHRHAAAAVLPGAREVSSP